MPALTVPANPASPIAAVATASGAASVGNSSPASGGAEGHSGNPFAAVLSRQMSGNAADTAAPKADETPSATGTAADSLAALLSTSFGTATASTASATMLGNRGKPLSDDEQAQANQAELALALLASPLAVAANTGGVTTDAGASASRLVGIGSATAAHADIADARGERRLLAESLPNPSAMTQLSEVPANVAVPQAAATTIAAANADAAKVARMELPASASPATAEARQKAEPAVTDATLPATVQVPMHAAATRQAAETDMLVAVPVGGKQWETAIGNSVVFMAGHQQNRAELVLTPPQLGRIEIALSINGDQASVLFVSPNPAVREALENALPRLREVLADAGITLGQAQIDSGSPQSSANGGDDGARRAATTDFAASQAVKAAATTVDNPWTRTARGLVDVFA